MFLNNRHYDPSTGVFVSVDPLVTVTGEPYIYGAANPVTYSDPSGLDPDTSAQVREKSEESGHCTYSSTLAACWDAYGPDPSSSEADDDKWLVLFGATNNDEPPPWNYRNPHRPVSTDNRGRTYVGGYCTERCNAMIPFDIKVVRNGGFGASVTGCFGPCISAGVFGTKLFLSIGELGLGVSVDLHVTSKGPCAQQGWAQGASFVKGVGGGASVSTPLPEGGWWSIEPGNVDGYVSVGPQLRGSVPVAGGTSYTWVRGC